MVVVDDLIKQKVRAAIDVISRAAAVRAVYLFRSRVTGEAHEFSDIDVAAFIDGADQLGLAGRVRLGVSVREKAGDDVEIHLFPAESLSNPPAASFAQYVIQHGLRLQ